MKKRPLLSILKDYISLIAKCGSNEDPDRDSLERSHFLPAKNPGPVIPTDSLITGYRRLREAFPYAQASVYFSFASMSETKIRILQNYILDPTIANWINLVDGIRVEITEMEKNELAEQLQSNNEENSVWQNSRETVQIMEKSQGGKSLTDVQIKKVEMMAKIAVIIGDTRIKKNSFDFTSLLARNSHDQEEKLSWPGEYYSYARHESDFVILKVYRDSSSARMSKLADFTKSLANNIRSEMTAIVTLNLITSFYDGNNEPRYILVPWSRCDEEIRSMMNLVLGGLITRVATIAVLNQQPGICECGSYKGARYSASCCIANVGRSRRYRGEPFDENGDTDPDFDDEGSDGDGLAFLLGF